jgi:methylphosphotriester-DNA--protein-cysteine methyltransferase
MKGRFRRACIRCASRIGRRERVKFAEENRASVERGGRPCLREIVSAPSMDRMILEAVLD